jgi:predicted transcriptional regulator
MASIEDVKRERERLGLSQWALAIRVGRSGAWLSLRETGYMSTSKPELEALDKALQEAEEELKAAISFQTDQGVTNDQ